MKSLEMVTQHIYSHKNKDINSSMYQTILCLLLIIRLGQSQRDKEFCKEVENLDATGVGDVK